jgi:hypothetical protein
MIPNLKSTFTTPKRREKSVCRVELKCGSGHKKGEKWRKRKMWHRGRVRNQRKTTAKEDKRQDSTRGSYNVWNESGSGG